MVLASVPEEMYDITNLHNETLPNLNGEVDNGINVERINSVI